MDHNVVFLNSIYVTDDKGNVLIDDVHNIGNSSFFILNENNIGWNTLDNQWLYLNKDKTLHKGWLKYSNDWYYLNSNGLMETGWETINGNKYYFNDNGAMES